MNNRPVIRNRARVGGHALRRRPTTTYRRPQDSQSTETAIEFDEYENQALDSLSAYFSAKRRFINPDQPIQHIRIPVVSLAAEREKRERKLEQDFLNFTASPPIDRNEPMRNQLIQGLSEWLERLEIGKMELDDSLAQVDEQMNAIDVRLQFYEQVASVAGQIPKI